MGSDTVIDHRSQRAALLHHLRDAGVLEDPIARRAIERVPREHFVPIEVADQAYADEPLAIGEGQTISAPHMVAIMAQALELRPGLSVLEVGAGSGYQAAVLAAAVGPTGRVTSIERIAPLADRARRALAQAEVRNVEVRVGDGSEGYPSLAPFDRIIVTAAAPDVPAPLLDQLVSGGILLVPVGRGRDCELIRVRRRTAGVTRESLGACAFVPLVGAHGHAREPLS